MIIKQPFLPLYKIFINESKNGKRLNKNGKRITAGTIKNYENAYTLLLKFSIEKDFDLRIVSANKLTKKEFLSEQKYWKKFYKTFTTYLYHNGCHDNYVGSQIKVLKTVFNYLKNNKGLNVGQFYTSFYVRKEEVEILVLSQERLKYFIHDRDFEKKLNSKELLVKDMFVMGCTTGFRYSDLISITTKNFKKIDGKFYISNKSKKTKTETAVLLPQYAINIFKKYKTNSSRNLLFGSISLNKFNETLKDIGYKAGFTEAVDHKREQRGVEKKLVGTRNKNIFCNKMSSHMMRRTAITTLLILGMPELLVRQISGHKYGSPSFMRYVKFAQVYLDKEIESVYSKLEKYQPTAV